MASEYFKWKYRDVQPDQPVERTKKQRRRNWWHYHKWHVVLAAAAVCVVGGMVWNAVSQVRPDYQIAYVASVPLAEEGAAVWEERLAALGTDCNGDGNIVVQLNQYLSAWEDAMYTAASNVKLMADLESNESYFFLLDDPEAFQAGYEVLREDWVPVEEGLYLARRIFWEDRTPENMAQCDILWERIVEEMAE